MDFVSVDKPERAWNQLGDRASDSPPPKGWMEVFDTATWSKADEAQEWWVKAVALQAATATATASC
ncbi:hypothetical protein HYFRA_00010338 [Hymenoscyphus fraxineus]|uniref:Uncharacterized protein n=1 Tax=Hymenoscyphus fraxineus TaxID=746836 RepID=A0A9N9KYN7_9HELO|nr:hypothetical protein HYFRA_00010338 [Hymenoscyphus fraxineus]